MKASYRVTLLRLSSDATSIEPLNHLPMELGEITPDRLRQLLENFAQFDVLTIGDEDPVIVIRRGDQGWRVTPGNRCLMFHDGVKTIDPIFPLDPSGILMAIAPGGTIPPFRIPPSPTAASETPATEDLSPATSSGLKIWPVFVVILVLLVLAFGWVALRRL